MKNTNDEMMLNVTADHLKLAQRMYVSWDGCDYGAPAIDCKRPYGNSDVERDICRILGLDNSLIEQQTKAREIHKEMKSVLQIILCTGKFEVGPYEKKDKYDARSWVKCGLV